MSSLHFHIISKEESVLDHIYTEAPSDIKQETQFSVDSSWLKRCWRRICELDFRSERQDSALLDRSDANTLALCQAAVCSLRPDKWLMSEQLTEANTRQPAYAFQRSTHPARLATVSARRFKCAKTRRGVRVDPTWDW